MRRWQRPHLQRAGQLQEEELIQEEDLGGTAENGLGDRIGFLAFIYSLLQRPTEFLLYARPSSKAVDTVVNRTQSWGAWVAK